jgi:hypothetical protein
LLNRTPTEYDRLLPYLEGTLDETQRMQVEARMAADPALAAEAERLRRTVSGLRGSASRLGPAENSEVPATLWPRLRARLEETPLPAPRPRSQSWWLAGVGATAAAGLAVAALWLPGWRTPEVRITPSAPAPTADKTPPVPRRNVLTAPPRSAQITNGPLGLVPAPFSVLPTAKKPVAAPPRVAAVPVRVPTPEYSITDPFALPATPAYDAPEPGSTRSVVDEQRRLKVTGEVQIASTAGTQERDRQTAADFVMPTSVPPPAPTSPAQAPRMQNASPAVMANGPNPIALGQNQPPLTVNGTLAAGAFGGGRAGGQAQQLEQTQHGQSQQTVDSQSKGSVPSREDVQIAQRPPNTPLFALRNNKATQRAAPMTFGGNGAQALDGNGTDNLDTWQNSLASALQSPQWGDNERVQQANQALMSAKISGQLDDLRARLEARQTQSPLDLVNARMLAAIYESGFSSEAALRERRRITGLEGAVGEDWFALAQAEEKRGNLQAARTAYRRALESPTPPTPFHVGIARGRS